MNEPTTAASPSGTPASGQAATPVQQGTQQPDQQTVQGGQATPSQGQQGEPAGSAAQPATTTTTPAQPAQPAQSTEPTRYELRLPEQSPLDQSDIEAVTKLATEKQWTNEQAQEVLTEMATSLSTQATTFRAELDADPEVGGAKLEQAQLQAQRVLDRFLPARETQGARLRSVMNKSGYGNFLPLVTLLARIGQAMSEDQPASGGGARVFQTTGQRSQADRLFGDAQGVKPPT